MRAHTSDPSERLDVGCVVRLCPYIVAVVTSTLRHTIVLYPRDCGGYSYIHLLRKYYNITTNIVADG